MGISQPQDSWLLQTTTGAWHLTKYEVVDSYKQSYVPWDVCKELAMLLHVCFGLRGVILGHMHQICLLQSVTVPAPLNNIYVFAVKLILCGEYRGRCERNNQP